jgi:hypothetical protein
MADKAQPRRRFPEKVQQRLTFYRRFGEKILYLAGGIGALLVVGGLADKSAPNTPPILSALFLLFAIIAGTSLALAKILTEIAVDRLQNFVGLQGEVESSLAQDVPDEDLYDVSNAATPLLSTAGFFVVLTTIILLIRAFWPVFAPPPDDQTCTISWHDSTAIATCPRTP